ncbi:PQQ-dependent sugar dehydrogenase [Fulvivirga kasyanovii]|uniref:Sorbosone dehydrogenase family protein n=1 Tax=Fulvivirga kasyanovii TaxID=396812 RepID=A0ABW9RPK7_9BACT|nr:PQQ-dependent sugar dehydrogenase [Fulvivirga kasyanovii]MTI25933.1 sorbosone dehydrogenase family protein [Fulvivirga kasyanovii]
MNRFLLAILICAMPGFALGQGNKEAEKIVGHVFKPKTVEATKERINSLKLPDGFDIEVFADQLGKPRMMAVTQDGKVYVTRRAGDVYLLSDDNKDGKAEVKKKVLQLDKVHGLDIKDDWLYMVTVNEVYRARINKNGDLGKPEKIMSDLPDGGQHANRTLAFGPEGKLYISIGSTCNACDETREESATLVVADPKDWSREVYAKGLRNTIGFDWEPNTRDLYGMDHGIDWLGDEQQKEELNKLVKGGNYGWPYIYGEGHHNPADEPPHNMTYEEYAKKVTNPVKTYTAHSSPLDMLFYTGEQFPEEYRNDAIVTFHGSWNREKAVGYKVIRINFKDGKPAEATDLVTGFLVNNDKEQFGRVTGLAMLPDGSLLISDDANGVIYRLSYSGS